MGVVLDREKVEQGVRLILEGLGINLEDENFRDTPKRVADFYEELLSKKIDSTDYVRFTQRSDLVIADGIVAYSLCPHHLLPVVYRATLAYLPKGKVVGVSKLVRILYDEASRIQLQEQLTERVADRLIELTGSEDVMVIVVGEHYCMRMRGVKSNARIITSAVRGAFLEGPEVRQELLALVRIK